jgi:hypothetical protein
MRVIVGENDVSAARAKPHASLRPAASQYGQYSSDNGSAVNIYSKKEKLL